MPKYIVQNQPYYAEDGDLKRPGTVVDLPAEKASYTNGWIEANDDGSPKIGKDGKPVVLKKASTGVPFHLMGRELAPVAPSVDSSIVLELAGKVAALEAKVAELEAASSKHPKK